jgi:hypothetical protein
LRNLEKDGCHPEFISGSLLKIYEKLQNDRAVETEILKQSPPARGQGPG